MESVSIGIECRWGVIPGRAEDGKKWFFTRKQLEEAKSLNDLLKEPIEVYEAHADPSQWNWVELTWVYY
jgi:hypothetical protein